MVLETTLYLIGALGVAIFSALAELMGTSLDEVVAGLGLIFSDLAQWGSNVLQWFTSIGTNITNGISSFWEGIVSFFVNGFENIKSKVTNGLNAVKTTFTNIFENVKKIVSDAVDFLKSIFNFEWKLPEIKLPHFTISGEFNLDPMNFSMPTIGIEWYQKAMSAPYLLDNAIIFGASSGKLLGAGESGKEIVYGHESLMRDIGAVVDSRLANMEFVVPVYIGGKKIDQQIVTANARNAVVSGGR